MGKVGRGADGVVEIGKRNGKRYWRARLYWVDPKTGREREKRATFQADSKHQAMAKRAELLELELTGKVVKVERKRWQEISDAWFATITVKSTRHNWGTHRRALDAQFGEYWLDAVTARELQDYLDACKGSPGYINSRRDVALHILDHGLRMGAVRSNVAKDTTKRSTRVRGDALVDPPKKALTSDESARVLADLRANEPDLYPLAMTQLILGCRFAEVSALRWDDVDLETGIVRIRRGQWGGEAGATKGRYARTAGLPLDARAMLRQHRDRMAVEQWAGWDVLVFPRPPYGSRKRHSNHWSLTTTGYKLQASYERCGIPVKGRTHVWRHTLVTLASALASEQLLRKIVGHTSAAVHANYRHAHDAEVIDLAEVVGRKLLNGNA